ncbi:protein kinase family protein [Legionella anisa]|uniref:Protein kinase family protein n=1 Tax=Legionella anisa TaxID=28082 RepID=A0AAX0WSC7_9GAMM|nr:protein kinase family protein [Legionella anisa]AWN74833.1 protein kinase family protein [Legionella anisa]KTC77702.1 protein kinase [Legionella anisa]MBN5936947.1 protein kinase family protein [Legionella anisa]MCW8424969.1 protein kinase family protein [Legionella anisa]MCW8445911.1 protein kinase family protein [Legionella anisa]
MQYKDEVTKSEQKDLDEASSSSIFKDDIAPLIEQQKLKEKKSKKKYPSSRSDVDYESDLKKEELEKTAPKYKFRKNRTLSTSSFASEYQSELGTVYGDQGDKLGKPGAYSRARQFKSKDGKKAKAILDPVKEDFDANEINTKFEFFNALYPGEVELIENGNTYRLALPVIPGKPYHKLNVTNETEQIELFLSAIAALKDCHDKGFVVIDLKEDNIFFDKKQNKSFLIDGGMSARKGEEIHPQFQVTQDATVQFMRKKCPHYAPECISKGASARAATSMDIYALGTMMKRVCKNSSPELTAIIDSCRAETPAQRPTLDQLETQLVERFKHAAKGCDLHLLTQLPEDLTSYEYSYIYCNDNERNTKKLYHIKSGGRSEEVSIDFTQFEQELNNINQEDATTLHLSEAQVDTLITSNGDHIPEQKEIIVDKNDEFFISLGKTEAHSFIMVGVIQNGEPIILGRVGKQNIEDISAAEFYLRNVFDHVDTELRDESLRVGGNIGYSAYAINYNQYLQFTELLSKAQRDSELHCYLPDREHNDTVIMTKKTLPTQVVSEQERLIVERSKVMSVGNTCRHTAIDLIEYTQGIPHLTDNVSRTFFHNLPLAANFSYGKPDRHFYVLPLPPSAYKNEDEGNKNKMVVLTKIFQRMEDLLKKDPYSDITIQKFDALKKLYCQQANIASDNIEEALNAIHQWRNENTQIISRLRDQGFFARRFASQSSTNVMVDEIIKEASFSKACSELEHAGQSNPVVGKLLSTVKKLKDDGTLSMSDLPRITQYLTDTTALIKDPTSVDAYNKHNENINDAFHRSWGPIIGGSMLCIAGILLAAAAITVTVLTFGVASPLTIPALAAGGAVTVAGVTLSATAFTAGAAASLAATGIAGIGIASKAAMFAHNAVTKDRRIATAMEEVSGIENLRKMKADLNDLRDEERNLDDNEESSLLM